MLVTIDKGYKPWLATSDDVTRPFLAGVCIQRVEADDPNSLQRPARAAATDTYGLVVVPAVIEFASLEEAAAFPAEGIIIPGALLKAAAGGKLATFCTVDLGTREARVSTKKGAVVDRLYDGQFVRYLPLLKKAFAEEPGAGEFAPFNAHIAARLQGALGYDQVAPWRPTTTLLPSGKRVASNWLLLGKDPRALALLAPGQLDDAAMQKTFAQTRALFALPEEPKVARTTKGKAKSAPVPAPAEDPDYVCCCSYPHGPHALHCINTNADRKEKAAPAPAAEETPVPAPPSPTYSLVRMRGAGFAERGKVVYRGLTATQAEETRERIRGRFETRHWVLAIEEEARATAAA